MKRITDVFVFIKGKFIVRVVSRSNGLVTASSFEESNRGIRGEAN
jgi:hypothetical protein